jgi:hypothetical protein
MRTFQDNAGRTWTVALSIWTVKRVRDVLGVDLLDLGGQTVWPTRTREGEQLPGNLLSRLIADPILLVDVLYVACKDQADAAGVTDEQFGRAMAGDSIDAATRAFLEELADFTPSPRDRARARKVLAATWRMIDKAQDVLDTKAERDLPKALDAALLAVGEPPGGESNRGSSSGSLPASSASTPAP